LTHPIEVFIQSDFIKSAADPKDFPKTSIPEVCFVGRSNCGKSSLLNALLNRKNLARKSATPGRTQLVNFFSWEDSTVIVDLPGYGYSATSDQVRKNWQLLVESYLERSQIRHVLFLMDGRRDLNDEDIEILKFLNKRHSTIFALTKTDKMNRSEIHLMARKVEKECSESGIELVDVFPTSSQKKNGIKELRERIKKP